jgi:hypothetical protein
LAPSRHGRFQNASSAAVMLTLWGVVMATLPGASKDG